MEVLFTSDRPEKSKIGIGFSLILIGIVTAIMQITPASDQGTSHSQAWMLKFDVRYLQNILNILPTAFFPIPQPTLHFWGSNYLNKLPFAFEIKFSLSILILLSIVIALLRRPTVLAMYLCGTSRFISFFLYNIPWFDTTPRFSLYVICRFDVAFTL